MNKFYSLLCILSCVNVAFGWFETCNQNIVLGANQVTTIRSANYPNKYPSGSSCKYTIVAPTGFMVLSECTLTMDQPEANCASQGFYISRDGDINLRASELRCSGYYSRLSIGNQMVLGYISNQGAAGYFTCTVKSVPVTQTNCDCGWNVNTKIVNGQNAATNEYVSMVGFIEITTKMVFCGGAIISENWILSATHCFIAYPNLANTGALVGDQDKSSGADTIYAALYKIVSVIKHELYNSNTGNNDIALVKTAKPMTFNRGVGPVCLPYAYMQQPSYFDNRYLEAVGWGAQEFAGRWDVPNILQKTYLTAITNTDCIARQVPNINSGKICSLGSNTDSCQRDSGGLLYFSAGGRKYATGIISNGVGCASSTPSTNTRVTSYVGWIESKLLSTTFFCRK